MKQTFLLSLIFCISANFLIAQTSFDNGFKEGYKNGYCQDKGVGCIEPIPPISPIPTVNESSSSYQDGYNRGFQMGMNAQKSSSNSTDRQRYQTSSAKFIDKMDNVDYSSAIQLALVLRESKGKALEYYQNEEYQASLDIALKGLSIKNNDEEFMILAGQALLRLNRYSEALPHLKRAYLITRDPNIKNVINDIENGKTEVKKETPNAQITSNNKIKEINALLRNAKYNDAITLIDQEIENSGNISLYGMRGMANFFKQNYSQSIFDITKSADETNNILPQYLFFRALAKSEVGDYFGAINDYDIIIPKGDDGQNYDMATLYNNKAYTYVKLKNFKEALSLVTKALNLNKNTWYIWDTRAEIYLNTEEYKKAIDDATKAIQIHEHSNSFFIRGMAHIKLNNRELGCKDLSRAGELGKKEAYDEIKKHCN
ncbi:tetratricopeptide repeat protein [Flavobacteriaceae bacterium MAR_2010_72]|nr:tetratricopeptide repeat protein [Flavobacteriaceae bacterium MAR_2010_72]